MGIYEDLVKYSQELVGSWQLLWYDAIILAKVNVENDKVSGKNKCVLRIYVEKVLIFVLFLVGAFSDLDFWK